MRNKISILFLICLACSSTKELKLQELYSENRIISIREHNYSYYIETIDLVSKDTINIISLKDNYMKQNKIETHSIKGEESRTIILNDTIKFILTKALFRPIAYGNNGYCIIVESDTLWKGEEIIDNRYFGSQNSVGLFINEWKKRK